MVVYRKTFDFNMFTLQHASMKNGQDLGEATNGSIEASGLLAESLGTSSVSVPLDNVQQQAGNPWESAGPSPTQGVPLSVVTDTELPAVGSYVPSTPPTIRHSRC